MKGAIAMIPSIPGGRLAGLRAVITGGAGGIGSAITRHFLAAGAEVALIDIDQEGMRKLAAESGPLVCLTADITQPQQVGAAAKAIADKWAKLDILVNSAGISGRPLGDGPVDVCPEDTWHRVLTTNLTAVYLTCKYFLPLITEQRGSIVHIASDDALIGPRPPHDTHAYVASKGGLVALTRAMAISYAPRGIRVNAIAPGWVMTPMTADLMKDSPLWDDIIGRHPLGRVATPNDIAAAAVFLASQEAAFVTGVILPVEGGATVW
jgi:NAD(P)-dependent dehydrogenase (short-subunit alcohol dehydrogenase family)